MPLNEILMEIQRVGNALRVSALDADTGTEVVFQAPLSTSNAEIKKLAATKLRYVMGKNSEAKIPNSTGRGN